MLKMVATTTATMIMLMCVRSVALELEPSTYVDIGDRVTASVDYGAGRNVNTEQFKARKEVRKITTDPIRPGAFQLRTPTQFAGILQEH